MAQAYSQTSEYEERKEKISEKSQDPSLVLLDLDIYILNLHHGMLMVCQQK